jgi:hypothetical protein
MKLGISQANICHMLKGLTRGITHYAARKIKVIKHSEGLLLTFVATLAQTYHNGRKEITIFIYGYKLAKVLSLTFLSAWCTLPLLAPNTRVNPCSKTW